VWSPVRGGEPARCEGAGSARERLPPDHAVDVVKIRKVDESSTLRCRTLPGNVTTPARSAFAGHVVYVETVARTRARIGSVDISSEQPDEVACRRNDGAVAGVPIEPVRRVAPAAGTPLQQDDCRLT
jgi:hypothetical protein